jgi:hypothetical protein
MVVAGLLLLTPTTLSGITFQAVDHFLGESSVYITMHIVTLTDDLLGYNNHLSPHNLANTPVNP